MVVLFTDFSIRVQSLEEEHSRVEILNNGQWGVVCANGWDTHDAIVVCQEKRLGNNGTAIELPYNQSETLWLSGVECMGNEPELSFCPHDGIGVVEDCEFVAGVECFSKILHLHCIYKRRMTRSYPREFHAYKPLCCDD